MVTNRVEAKQVSNSLQNEPNMRDDNNIPASIREAIAKRQVSLRRKSRI
jgi:hypothetical protein